MDGVACHDPGAPAPADGVAPVDFRFAAGVDEDGAGEEEGFEPSAATPLATEVGGSFLFLIAAL